MPVYKPWPQDAYPLYRQIETSQDTILDFASFCLEPDNRRFKEIPVALTPIILKEAINIRRCSNLILEMFIPKKGIKYPKWYKITEQVEELAANIEMLVKKEIEPMLRVNQMIVVWARLREVEDEALKIKKSLKQMPRPFKPSGLEVWKEAIEEALK